MEGKGYLAGKLLEEWKPFMQSETVQTGNVKLSSSLGLPLEVRGMETVQSLEISARLFFLRIFTSDSAMRGCINSEGVKCKYMN